MHEFWTWLNSNATAVQALASLFGALLTLATIIVLVATYRAARAQADAARALTEVANRQTALAKEQTETINQQTQAALRSASATETANRISEETNRLSLEQVKEDLRPMLVYAFVFDQSTHNTLPAIRNIGHGVANNVQLSIGTAKDDLPKQYIPQARSVIGASDEVFISIDRTMVQKAGMTIHYTSMDERCFTSTVYYLDGSIRQEFEEYAGR
jgi:hypothetical protein